MFGGAQELGLRPGTLPTHQIVGMGLAALLAQQALATEPPRIAALRDQLWSAISDIPGLIHNCAGADRVCGILSVSVEGVEGESLLHALRSLAVASGSACNTDSDDASYVLRALGRSDQLAESTIRFSLGRFTDPSEIPAAAAVFRSQVLRLREYTACFKVVNEHTI
jgi:cysteine desulfurase